MTTSKIVSSANLLYWRCDYKSNQIRESGYLINQKRLLWRMLSRLETCIVYSCIWSVTLAKSIFPRKTWRKLWHSYISKLFLTKMQVKFSIFFHHGILNVIGDKFRFVHNGSCHKQQMINNDKLIHGKPQIQLWIDSLNEMFLSRWTALEKIEHALR
jgi:hypothetical protein